MKTNGPNYNWGQRFSRSRYEPDIYPKKRRNICQVGWKRLNFNGKNPETIEY
jgi:hypothetical protein